MSEIDKNFDGVLWEWKGRKAIRELKPICPKCQYEMEIKPAEIRYSPRDPISHYITITQEPVSYSCPKCSFSNETNIDGVNNPEDLHKSVQKEFEHRQRLKASENTKD